MKYYSFETSFHSLKEQLREFLIKNGFKFEISGEPGFWHFEILLDESGVKTVNKWIDENRITEEN